jgi:hypothetical protein
LGLSVLPHAALEPEVEFATYLGGGHIVAGFADDAVPGTAMDLDGNVIVAGMTTSNAFPAFGGFDTTDREPPSTTPQGFLAKFNDEGNLLWSTYVRGTETSPGGLSGHGATHDVGVDILGNIYVTGFSLSIDLPVLNPFQATNAGGFGDAFLSKISPEGELLWSTYFGGSASDEAHKIAVDPVGNVAITGKTRSNDFPTLNAVQDQYQGIDDLFVAKFSSEGQLPWSTYLGSTYNDGSAYTTISSIASKTASICMDTRGRVTFITTTHALGTGYPLTQSMTSLKGMKRVLLILRVTAS